MKECLEVVKGTHDFSSFYSAGDGKINPVRNIMQAELNLQDNNILSFHLGANGFLRHMVRNIMGTIVQAGLGEINTASVEEILASKDRQKAGVMAPPGGLYLKDVRY
jgi:tRNA pseudouridine38-40 synthase